MIVTAGGATICCWDLFSGGKLLHKFAAHQKTITSVAVQRTAASSASSDGPLRILSSSLDGHVKVHFRAIYAHFSPFLAPFLSF